MPLEGIPMGAIMMTVTGFLTVSAFIVFGVTCFNMRKKRNSKLSTTGADESLPADPTAVVVVPVVAQMTADDVKDSSLVVVVPVVSLPRLNMEIDTTLNNEGSSDKDTNNEVGDASGATIDAAAGNLVATATTVTTATAADGAGSSDKDTNNEVDDASDAPIDAAAGNLVATATTVTTATAADGTATAGDAAESAVESAVAVEAGATT